MNARVRAFITGIAVLSLLILSSCGGGGGGSSSAPLTGGGTQSALPKTAVTAASSSLTRDLAGGFTVVSVKVVDDQNVPVSGATVTFSSSATGLELFPTQATTTRLGIARTIVHLPTTVNSSFTVNASAASGGSFSQTVTTGMRLVRTLGTPNVSGGAVRPDVTFLAGATGLDVAGAFNPDGPLKKTVTSPYPAGIVPAIGMYPSIALDGTPLYWDSQQGFLTLLDSNLNPVTSIDLFSRAGTGYTPPPVVDSLPAPVVDASHKIYTVPGTCDAFYALDASGSVIGLKHDLSFDYNQQIFEGGCYITLSPSGNPVVYGIVPGANQSANYFLAVEYDPNGNVLHRAQLSILPRLFAQADGTYITDTATPGHVSVMDTSFHLVRDLFSTKVEWGALAGVDTNGRYYFQTRSPGWEKNTGDIGSYTVVEGGGNVLFSSGEKDDSTASYPMYNQNHGTGVFTADATSDTVYAIRGSASGKYYLVVYKNGTYLASYPTTMSNRAQLSPSGQFYDTPDYFGTMRVYDLRGSLVKAVTYPQMANTYRINAIRIDSQDYKYVDVDEKTVYVLAPDDSYVKAIAIPSPWPRYPGFDLTPDGNFIFVTSAVVQKIDQNGIVLWSSQQNPYLFPAVGSAVVDAAGRIYFGSLVMDSNGNKLSDVGFFKTLTVPFGRHVLMFGLNTIYELSAE
ncbi:MAG: Ig-like domain-containing protein [Terriglobales bacterium]